MDAFPHVFIEKYGENLYCSVNILQVFQKSTNLSGSEKDFRGNHLLKSTYCFLLVNHSDRTNVFLLKFRLGSEEVGWLACVICV